MQDTDGNVIDTELRFLNIGRRENYDFNVTSVVSLHLKLEVISIIEHAIAFVLFLVVSNLLNTLIDYLKGYSEVLG